ncbi:VOC family protein [Sphingomonas sp. UYP23]
MPRMIFINLPVSDVAASTAFYEAIGFVKNPAFSNDQGACLVWSDSISVMVAAKAFYATLTTKPIADTQATSGALFALAFDSRAAVDAIAEAAVAAGGREAHGPEDEGFMYSRAFWDLDGHGFGPFWMDPAAVENGPPATAEAA